MSTEKVEKGESPNQKHEGSSTVELGRKLMQIGQQKYTIDIRQNGDSRFCRIIDLGAHSHRNRIVVPMCVVEEFCGKLSELAKFASTYAPKNVSERKSSKERTNFAHSVSFVTQGGRRYYFDIVDANDVLTARISYVFVERYVVFIVCEALTSLCEVLQKFAETFPSQTTNDDYPPSQRARNYMMRGRGNRMSPRYGRGRFRGNYSRGRGQNYYNNNGGGERPTQTRAPTDPKRVTTLKVLNDPAPTQVTHNAKKFTLEFVEGANTFLRITEIINDMRKSTLHVPIEVCPQIQNLIGDMNKRLNVVQKPAPVNK